MDCLETMELFRGTTPTIYFDFNNVDPADFTSAFLVLKQNDEVVIEKGIDSAAIEENKISWTLTQEETLLLEKDTRTHILCDWRTNSGIRGTSKPALAKISDSGKNEVI